MLWILAEKNDVANNSHFIGPWCSLWTREVNELAHSHTVSKGEVWKQSDEILISPRPLTNFASCYTVGSTFKRTITQVFSAPIPNDQGQDFKILLHTLIRAVSFFKVALDVNQNIDYQPRLDIQTQVHFSTDNSDLHSNYQELDK